MFIGLERSLRMKLVCMLGTVLYIMFELFNFFLDWNPFEFLVDGSAVVLKTFCFTIVFSHLICDSKGTQYVVFKQH